MTALELLQRGRELISELDHWTKGWYAKTLKDERTSLSSSDAHSFCSLGALHKAYETNAEETRSTRNLDAARLFLQEEMNFSIAGFNDHHTHAEVLAAWDRAIQRAKDAEKEDAHAKQD